MTLVPCAVSEPEAVRAVRDLRLPLLFAFALVTWAGGRIRAAADGAEPLGFPWVSPLGRDHRLVGEIWEVAGRRFVHEAALFETLREADIVLFGETHDNADHHRLEARFLRGLMAAGRRPTVAFEMLDPEQQPGIDAARAHDPGSPEALAAAVRWVESGWPDFALYRPVFAAALDGGLPIVAANLSRAKAREVMRRGPDALGPPARALLERAGPLPEAAARELRQEMLDSHCGKLPERMLDGFVAMQRARDATLSARLLARTGGDGAVLVAGAGHVRADRGVPVYLALATPAPRVRTVAFLEVDAGAEELLAGEPLPFDFVVFTPRAEREDPCATMKAP